MCPGNGQGYFGSGDLEAEGWIPFLANIECMNCNEDLAKDDFIDLEDTGNVTK